MISFKVLPEREDVEKYLKNVKEQFTIDGVFDEMRELLLGYQEMDGDDGHAEIATAVSSGCLLIRICRYDYAFLCPIPINESASIADAADDIRKYAIKEEIPICFIDVDENDISELCEPFRFTENQPMDDEGEVFAVIPVTEAGRFGDLPTVEGNGIILNALSEEDIPEYARLCRDGEVNRLYGNDYSDDFGEDASDEAFFFNADAEVSFGISMIFAIRQEGALVGEAAIFDFDYVGGAKVAIRLLPEFWGKGIGSEALRLLLEVAKEVDLRTVSTAVKKENTSSIRMTEKYMNYKGDNGDTAAFEVIF